MVGLDFPSQKYFAIRWQYSRLGTWYSSPLSAEAIRLRWVHTPKPNHICNILNVAINALTWCNFGKQSAWLFLMRCGGQKGQFDGWPQQSQKEPSHFFQNYIKLIVMIIMTCDLALVSSSELKALADRGAPGLRRRGAWSKASSLWLNCVVGGSQAHHGNQGAHSANPW